MSKSSKKQHSFVVTSNEHGWKQTFTIEYPTDVADPTWMKYLADENIKNETLMGNVVIKLAAMLRTYVDPNVAAVDLANASIIIGGKKATPPTMLTGFNVAQQKEITKANPSVRFIFN